MPIEHLARSDAVTAAPESLLTELATTMDEESVVITSNGGPVGIVTADDITELRADEQQPPGEVIRSQRPEY